jgi:flagellar hook protein FlgE
LVRLGENLYQESTNSGLPQIGAPLTGGLGSIVSGALEGSNVDLASTFADMLVTQRGFQANSRVITTADQLIQDLLTLGR